MTRYEIPGGCTQTSTERRIRFSPEIPGPRIPEARAEWEIPALVARAVLPDGGRLFPYRDTREIRREMDSVMPLYRGIASLEKEGDHFQWGGPRLCEGWRFDGMPEGKARLVVEDNPIHSRVPPGRFRLATRRGKQFNSMVFDAQDPLVGRAGRDALLMNERDAADLGLRDGQAVLVVSETGRMEARLKIAGVRPRTVQAFWPECNVLIGRCADPVSKEPDYNAFVEIRPWRAR
jgi:predicted molibdopterin-dependent oxidoreductase YjgC